MDWQSSCFVNALQRFCQDFNFYILFVHVRAVDKSPSFVLSLRMVLSSCHLPCPSDQTKLPRWLMTPGAGADEIQYGRS